MLVTGFYIVLSYLIGSISPARIIAGIYRVDLDRRGTKNPGATNVYKLIGPVWGIITGAIDFCKGFMPVYLARSLLNFNMFFVILVALGAIVGHNWPVFYNFSGGRGLATSMGTLGAVNFIPGLIAFIIGSILVWCLRKMFALDWRIPFLVFPVFVIITILSNYNLTHIIYALMAFALACFRAWQVKKGVK